jgi:hypothetical protein
MVSKISKIAVQKIGGIITEYETSVELKRLPKGQEIQISIKPYLKQLK